MYDRKSVNTFCKDLKKYLKEVFKFDKYEAIWLHMHDK